jgi:hypothetical protein
MYNLYSDTAHTIAYIKLFSRSGPQKKAFTHGLVDAVAQRKFHETGFKGEKKRKSRTKAAHY